MKGDIDDVILKTISRILVPFIQVFSLYVLTHGHTSPGGGFQGGCIMACSFILLALSFGLSEVKKRLKENTTKVFLGLGVSIYAVTGCVAYLMGGNFLDYGSFSKIFPLDQAKSRYVGIFLVEIGVQITVMASMFSIFYDLMTGDKNGDN